MNSVVLTGRITKDPELRKTEGGDEVVSFSLAVNRIVKDKQGNYITDFINCVAWKNSATYLSKYVHKGNLLCVRGTMQNRKYNDKSGAEKFITEVICEQVESAESKNKEQPKEENKESKEEPKQANTSTIDINDDDLPF